MLLPRVCLPVEMLPQPDETTCGPTCLHAIYWGREEPLSQVIARSGQFAGGGGARAPSWISAWPAIRCIRHGCRR